MRVLNLAHPERTEVAFKLTQFPDGQQDVTILGEKTWITPDKGIEESRKLGKLDTSRKIVIKSRFNSFRDLEIIICATVALRGMGVKVIELHIPYIVGARSDRQFIEGGTSYLRDVIAPILNYMNYERVVCLDPHSDVAAATIKNLVCHNNVPLVTFALNQIKSKDFVLVSPDGGALKKVYKVADAIDYKGDVIVCSKSRDNEGRLTKTEVPLEQKHIDRDFIIIDDICDGGRTFINIAERIKAMSDSKIYLVVTHGIFSKGFRELNKYFDGIYSTNSYVDKTDETFSMIYEKQFEKLHQLNIF
jgi:ribose-phosphate pyrophosphokinase